MTIRPLYFRFELGNENQNHSSYQTSLKLFQPYCSLGVLVCKLTRVFSDRLKGKKRKKSDEKKRNKKARKNDES